MSEVPKRLAPSPQTFRELFLKSGNLCAFPGCDALMMDEEGTFIGQVCHIEAAEPGGERFNPNMSNEERRSFANLFLMCYAHHQTTNSVERYSATALKEMKAAHERRYSGPDRAMYERLAKMKWATLVGAGVIAGVGINELARDVRSLMKALAGPTESQSRELRKELLQRLRYAPTGTVYCYSRDAPHKAVGEEILAIFGAAGWKVSRLEKLPEEMQLNAKRSALIFVLPRKDQVSNAHQAIDEVFHLSGFSIVGPSEGDEDEVVGDNGGYRINFRFVVGSAK